MGEELVKEKPVEETEQKVDNIVKDESPLEENLCPECKKEYPWSENLGDKDAGIVPGIGRVYRTGISCPHCKHFILVGYISDGILKARDHLSKRRAAFEEALMKKAEIANGVDELREKIKDNDGDISEEQMAEFEKTIVDMEIVVQSLGDYELKKYGEELERYQKRFDKFNGDMSKRFGERLRGREEWEKQKLLKKSQ